MSSTCLKVRSFKNVIWIKTISFLNQFSYNFSSVMDTNFKEKCLYSYQALCNIRYSLVIVIKSYSRRLENLNSLLYVSQVTFAYLLYFNPFWLGCNMPDKVISMYVVNTNNRR